MADLVKTFEDMMCRVRSEIPRPDARQYLPDELREAESIVRESALDTIRKQAGRGTYVAVRFGGVHHPSCVARCDGNLWYPGISVLSFNWPWIAANSFNSELLVFTAKHEAVHALTGEDHGPVFDRACARAGIPGGACVPVSMRRRHWYEDFSYVTSEQIADEYAADEESIDLLLRDMIHAYGKGTDRRAVIGNLGKIASNLWRARPV